MHNLNEKKELMPTKNVYTLSMDELRVVNLTDEQVLAIDGDAIGIQESLIIIKRFGKILAKRARENEHKYKHLWGV